jgi:hypothetical protein
VRLVSGPTNKYSYTLANGPTRAWNSFQVWSTVGLNKAISISEARVLSSM